MASPSLSHAYPPQPTSQQQHFVQPTSPPDLVSYLVNTATDSILDLRLQVTQDSDPPLASSSSASSSFPSSSSKRPLRPLWFRERSLSAEDEIVDELVDANTALVAWTIHRPVRGWYLHLRSPFLPPGTAIALRPSRPPLSDPTTSPLSFSLYTSIDHAELSGAFDSLESVAAAVQARVQHKRTESHAFTTIALDGSATEPRRHGLDGSALRTSSSLPTSRSVSASGTGPSTRGDAGAEDANDSSTSIEAEGRTTSRVNMHVSTSSGQGHTRRRSAGGCGAHAPDIRKVSSSMAENAPGGMLVGEPPKEEDEELGEDGQMSHNERQKRCSPYADRPYSPIEPKPFAFGADGPASAFLNAKGGATTSRKGALSRRLRPQKCTFVLSDGVGPVQPRYTPSGPDSGSSTETTGSRPVPAASRSSWARRAWALIPSPIRPMLGFDTSKSFSLRWVDPPSNFSASPLSPARPTFAAGSLDRIGSSVPGGPGSAGAGPGVGSQADEHEGGGGRAAARGEGVEVLRFEDRTGMWFWQAKCTSGRLVLQESAIRALGLDRGFWIATALAYLEFLQDKDGYAAAADG